MATVNFTKPVTSDLRADVLAYIRDAINSQARMFDGDTLVSLPTGTVRYNAGNTRFEIWNGATWGTLNIAGQGSFLPLTGGTLTGTLNVDDGTGGYVQLKSGDVTGTGFIDFRNAADDRTGYIGYATGGYNNIVAGAGYGWYTTGAWLFDSGKIGLGSAAVEATWASGRNVLKLHATSALWADSVAVVMSNNGIWDGTNWKYITTAPITDYYQYNGEHVWRGAFSGTAGTNATMNIGMMLKRRSSGELSDLALGGSAPSNWGSLGGTLDLKGPLGALSFFQQGSVGGGTGNDSWICSNLYFDGSDWRFVSNGHGTAMTQYNGYYEFRSTTSAGTAGAVSTHLPRFSINTGGGVYVHSPSITGRHTLEVLGPPAGNDGFYTANFTQGNAQNWGKVMRLGTTNSGGTDGPQIHFIREGYYEWGFGIGSNTSDMVMYAGGNTAGFGTERFRFGTDGNFTMVGTNPTITLRDTDNRTGYIHVNSDIFYILTGVNGAGYGGWGAVGNGSWPLQINLSNNNAQFGGDVTTTGPQIMVGTGQNEEKRVRFSNANRDVYFALNGTAFNLWDVTGGFNRWTTDASGNFVAYGNVTAYSDERLKTDFFSARVTLEQMLLVEPEGFRRVDTGMWQVGVRAQALQKIMPLSVLKGADGYLTVNYGAAAMVLALSLAREVAELKEELHGKNRQRH